MPRGGAEAGYLRPGPPDVPHALTRPAVFRAVPPDILGRYENRHRVGIWSLVPKAPMALLGPLLRHELEHAAHWKRYGRSFTDLDAHLREVWGADRDDERYLQLPSERACNDAASRFAARWLKPIAHERLKRNRRYRQLAGVNDGPPGDVLSATIEALREAGEKFLQHFDDAARVERLQRMEESAGTWPQDILEQMRDDETDDLIFVRPHRASQETPA